jgi:hypothetical protein
MWVVFLIPSLGISGFAIIVHQVGLFSAPLPIISDYLSPDHISCMKGGVSSAVAAFRAPAHSLAVTFNLI